MATIELGELSLNFLGSWEAEATLVPGLRIPVTYVQESKTGERSVAEGAMRAALERIARDEWGYRQRSAAGWLATFHEERPETRGWDADRLARTLSLCTVILGDHGDKVILQFSTTMPDVDGSLSSWFNPDGTLAYVSGGLD